jgi:hypothetical protein
MKDHWENIGNEIHAFKDSLETLLDMLPQSAKIYKQVASLQKSWGKVQRAVNDMDPFITPVKSIEVKSPLLADADFKATWKFWKEYLGEQHGIAMRSRAELMALKRLIDISEEKPQTAVAYLEFAMSRMDKNFYKVHDMEVLQADKNAETKTGIKIALPPQYQQKVNNEVASKKTEHPDKKKQPTIKQKTLQEEIEDYKKSKRKSNGKTTK